MSTRGVPTARPKYNLLVAQVSSNWGSSTFSDQIATSQYQREAFKIKYWKLKSSLPFAIKERPVNIKGGLKIKYWKLKSSLPFPIKERPVNIKGGLKLNIKIEK